MPPRSANGKTATNRHAFASDRGPSTPRLVKTHSVRKQSALPCRRLAFERGQDDTFWLRALRHPPRSPPRRPRSPSVPRIQPSSFLSSKRLFDTSKPAISCQPNLACSCPLRPLGKNSTSSNIPRAARSALRRLARPIHPSTHVHVLLCLRSPILALGPILLPTSPGARFLGLPFRG